jgi:hypothetical protein
MAAAHPQIDACGLDYFDIHDVPVWFVEVDREPPDLSWLEGVGCIEPPVLPQDEYQRRIYATTPEVAAEVVCRVMLGHNLGSSDFVLDGGRDDEMSSEAWDGLTEFFEVLDYEEVDDRIRAFREPPQPEALEPEAPAPVDAPKSRLIRSYRDAELVAAEWLDHFGLGPCRLTPPGPDGGIDVESLLVVAQVKMEALPTRRPVIQQLFGVAAAERKTGAFFSLAGYTPDAATWAHHAGLALFRFDLQGVPKPVNAAARTMAAFEGHRKRRFA